MARSAEATAIYEMFLSINAKAPWSEPDSFAELVEVCREEQRAEAESGYIVPEFLIDCVCVEVSDVDGSPLVTIFPKEEARRSKIRVLYYHGGAFFKRISEDQWKLCVDLVERTGCTISASIYPLAPTHTCEKTYDAAYAAYQHELAAAKESDSEFVLMGDSAGGSMSFAVAQLALQRGSAQPDRIVGISPFFDMVGAVDIPTFRDAKDPLIGWYGCQQIVKLWAPELDETAFPPDALYGPKEGLPESLIIGGEHEIMLTGMRAFAQEAQEAGCTVEFHEFEGMWHIFPILGHLPEAQLARTTIARFITEGANS